MAKVLVIRTSSLGDVAMLVPVLYSVAMKYPQDRFSIMTRKAFAPLFENLAFNINVIPLDTVRKHSGIIGFFRVAPKLIFSNFSHVVDEHNVLRSKVIRFFMLLTFRRVAHINKGKSEKLEMIRTKDTSLPLKSTIQRYREVFDKLGFVAPMAYTNYFEFIPRDFSQLSSITNAKKGTWIGIAPFAKHEGKIYPLDKMKRVVELLSKDEDTTIFLFGSGKVEGAILNEWSAKHGNVINACGKINLQRELLLISYMDVMVTMDSANMHLASLVQTPVVSVWGATHPSLGFYGFEQDRNNAVIVATDCNPCSVYGDKLCSINGYSCMTNIEEQTIVDKIYTVLKKK